jgi:hypothetical protein
MMQRMHILRHVNISEKSKSNTMNTNPNKLSPDEIEALDQLWSMIDVQDTLLTILTEAEIDELDRLDRAKKKGSGTPHEL